jgi:hypothetical protein
VFALEGSAALTQTGAQQAGQLLAKVFPSTPPTKPLGFAVEREFELVNGSISSSAPEIGGPRLRFDLDWDTPTLPDLKGLDDLAGKLKIDIGKPSLTLPLDSGSGAAGWTLRLRDCALHFPSFDGLKGLSLAGLLTLESTATEDKLLFAPTSGGEFQLPDIVRFFLSRLGWHIDPGVDLATVVEAAEMSQGDWDWARFFGNLLPDPLPTGPALTAFAAAIGSALDEALKTLSRPRAYYLIFSGLDTPDATIADVVWDDWFARLPNLSLDPIDELPSLLLELRDLPDDLFGSAAGTLMTRQLSFPEFCKAASTRARSPATGCSPRSSTPAPCASCAANPTNRPPSRRGRWSATTR